MRDLLAYFEAAGATDGPVNWVLVLGDDTDELEVDLDAFKRWIKAAEKSKSAVRMVPELGSHELFEMRKCFYPTREKDSSLAPGEADYRQPTPRIKSAELTKWLDAYERGDYLDLPKTVAVALAEKGPVGDVAAVLIEIYSAIRAIANRREEFRRKGYAPHAGGDFWSAKGLWLFETDHWVRGRVLDLAAYEQATKKATSAGANRPNRYFQEPSSQGGCNSMSTSASLSRFSPCPFGRNAMNYTARGYSRCC